MPIRCLKLRIAIAKILDQCCHILELPIASLQSKLGVAECETSLRIWLPETARESLGWHSGLPGDIRISPWVLSYWYQEIVLALTYPMTPKKVVLDHFRQSYKPANDA